jgi:hypothetical protein
MGIYGLWYAVIFGFTSVAPVNAAPQPEPEVGNIEAAYQAAKAAFGRDVTLDIQVKDRRGFYRQNWLIFVTPEVENHPGVFQYQRTRCDWARYNERPEPEWRCEKPRDEARLYAGGLEHRITFQTPVDLQMVLEIANFMHSPCFTSRVAEYRELAKPKPDFFISRFGAFAPHICAISKRDSRFNVLANGSMFYELDVDDSDAASCQFKLHRVWTSVHIQC